MNQANEKPFQQAVTISLCSSTESLWRRPRQEKELQRIDKSN